MTYSLAVDAKLKDLINEEIENWEDGQSCTFKFSFSEVGLVHEPSESDLEILVSDLPYIEVNSYVLEQRFNRQMAQWEREGQLERAEYHRSRGVI